MKTWCIFGDGLKDLHIIANSFDEAIAAARERNKNYNGGYLEKNTKRKKTGFFFIK